MPAGKSFYYLDLRLEIPESVYEPKEDSVLLADNLELRKGDSVLDVGTGSGLQAIIAAEKAERVVAVDINPKALEAARKNAENNRRTNIDFRLSDLLSEIKPEERFDLIIFNPPYIPSDEADLEARAWAGGKEGRKTIDTFIEEAPKHLKKGGRMLLLVSSLNNPEQIMKRLEEKGLKTEVTAKKKLWFEELCIIKASG